MGLDWPELGFPTPFPAKYGLRIIIRKTYFYQKMELYLLKIDINNTEKNRPDLPVSAVALPSPYLSSRRGLRPKYFLRKIVKISNFLKIVKSNPMPFLKGQLQGIKSSGLMVTIPLPLNEDHPFRLWRAAAAERRARSP